MMRWSRLWVIALTLVAVLLGHDAIMAAAPHRAETERLLSRVEAGVTPESGMDSAHDAPSMPDMGFASVCAAPDTGRTTAPDLGFDGPPLTGIVPAVAFHLAGPTRERIGRHMPPAHPPATRRAMLQVFLN